MKGRKSTETGGQRLLLDASKFVELGRRDRIATTEAYSTFYPTKLKYSTYKQSME
jgi:hypothetical protein